MQQVLVDDGGDGGVTVEECTQIIIGDAEHFGVRQRPDGRGGASLVDEGVFAEAIAGAEFVQTHRRYARFRFRQKSFCTPLEHDVQAAQLVALVQNDVTGGDGPGYAGIEQGLAQRFRKAIEDLVSVELDLGHRAGLQ